MARSEKATPAGAPSHDHGDHAEPAFGGNDPVACVQTALAAADAACARRGLPFTPVRRRVPGILIEAHEAMGACEVLARLDAEGLGAKPPVANRALGFWLITALSIGSSG